MASVGGAAHGVVTAGPGLSFHYRTADARFEGTDSFTYTVSDGHGGTATNTITVTINPAPVWVSADGWAAEAGDDGGVRYGTFVLSRPAESTLYDLTVPVSFLGGDWRADPTADFHTPNDVTVATFLAGETTATLTVVPYKDNQVEGWETIHAVFAAGGGYRLNWGDGDAEADLGLADDPPVVSVLADESTLTGEGAAGEVGTDAGGVQTGDLILTRAGGDGSQALPVRVRFWMWAWDGAAGYGADYTVTVRDWVATPGSDPTAGEFVDVTLAPDEDGWVTVTFGPGEAEKRLTVVPKKDDLVEGTEYAHVEIGDGGTGYLVGTPGMADLDILDTGLISIARVTNADEADLATGTFLFTRTGDLSQSLTVDVQFKTGDGFATPDDDFTAETTVQFAPDSSTATLTVVPKKDNLTEGTERVRVVVLPAPNGEYYGAGMRADLDLLDDAPVIRLELAGSQTLMEGETTTLTVRRSGGDMDAPLTVVLSVGPDDENPAVTVDDLAGNRLTPGTLTIQFPPSQPTVLVSLTADDEPDVETTEKLKIGVAEVAGKPQKNGPEVKVDVVDKTPKAPLPRIKFDSNNITPERVIDMARDGLAVIDGGEAAIKTGTVSIYDTTGSLLRRAAGIALKTVSGYTSLPLIYIRDLGPDGQLRYFGDWQPILVHFGTQSGSTGSTALAVGPVAGCKGERCVPWTTSPAFGTGTGTG